MAEKPEPPDIETSLQAYNEAPLGLAHCDADLRYRSINKAMAAMHAQPVAAHLGRRPADILQQGLARLHEGHARRVLETGEPILDVCERVESPQHDLTLRDWLMSYVPLRDADGRVSGVVQTAVDITPRRDDERRLRAERRVARILATAERLDDALQSALDAILESFELCACEFWLPDSSGKLERTMLRTSDNLSAQALEAIPLAFGDGLIGRVAETLEPVWIADVRTDPQFRRSASARSAGLRAGFAFPVIVNESCFGVISLFSKRRLDVGPSLAEVLARLGQEIGQFVRHAETKREAREYGARTRVVVESALDSVISIDEQGLVLEWNPRAEQMFGYARAEAMNTDLASLIIPEKDRAAHRAGMRRFLETGEGPVLNKRIEVSARHRDGTDFPVELAVLPLALEDKYEFTAYIRDITERKEYEAALLEADRRKTEFLAILGHELRNPLATIANCVHLIDDGVADARELVSVMRPQVEHLRFLLDDLLDITRINHGKIALNKRVVNLERVLRGAIDATHQIIQERGQTLRTELDGAVSCDFYADGTRIQQIVGNLLTNAAKYSPPGTIISLQARCFDDQVEISVADQGIGIPADRIDDIFEAFTQIREAPTGAGGLGIGLTLVRLLTEMHGGTVRVESEGDGHGSVFKVLLPATLPIEAVVSRPPAPPVAALGREMKVLIVDDNESAATTMGQLLEHTMSCAVEVVFDGESALSAARKNIPDAMLVDIKLPDMSGLDIAATLRADPRFASTRLIAVSGFGHVDATRDSLAAGFEAHLAKPVELSELLSLLGGQT